MFVELERLHELADAVLCVMGVFDLAVDGFSLREGAVELFDEEEAVRAVVGLADEDCVGFGGWEGGVISRSVGWFK